MEHFNQVRNPSILTGGDGGCCSQTDYNGDSYQSVVENCCERIIYELDTIKNASNMLNVDYNLVCKEKASLEEQLKILSEQHANIALELQNDRERLSVLENIVMNVIAPMLIADKQAQLNSASQVKDTTKKKSKPNKKKKVSMKSNPDEELETATIASQPLNRQPSILEYITTQH